MTTPAGDRISARKTAKWLPVVARAPEWWEEWVVKSGMVKGVDRALIW